MPTAFMRGLTASVGQVSRAYVPTRRMVFARIDAAHARSVKGLRYRRRQSPPDPLGCKLLPELRSPAAQRRAIAERATITARLGIGAPKPNENGVYTFKLSALRAVQLPTIGRSTIDNYVARPLPIRDTWRTSALFTAI